MPSVRRAEPRVLAGEAALDRAVRWVHVGELADLPTLLRGGELVLTTGIALPEVPQGLARFVDDLADVGAAGLVVELGRRFAGTLPSALVSAARRRKLPLVELHREARFVEITEAVHARIVNAQIAELTAAEQVHQTFTELSVEGAEPAEVVRHVARIAGRPVVLENLAHQVLAYEPAGADPDDVLDAWEARARRVRPAERTGFDPESGWLVTVVGARGQDWGRLIVIGTPGSEPPRLHHVLIERGASALALDRLVRREQEGLERQSHRSVIAAILGPGQQPGEVAVRAGALGVPLNNRRLVGVVLRPRATSPAPPEALAMLRDLAEATATATRRSGQSALVGVVEDGVADEGVVAVLLSLPRGSDPDAGTERLAQTVRVTAAETGIFEPLVVAAGTPVDSVREARRSLVEAIQVAEAAGHVEEQDGHRRSYYRLPDVRLRGLLHLLRNDPRLQTFVEREIGPLLEHDAAQGDRLVAVLGTYLDHGRNKSAAAEASHLSRPAFYDRLRRIERILGVDLDSSESCLSLHVALLALHALRRPLPR